MNITSVNSGVSVQQVTESQVRMSPASTAVAEAKSDTVSISGAASKVSSYISAVKEMPEARQQTVNDVSEQVGSFYPPPAVVEALTRFIGMATKELL